MKRFLVKLALFALPLVAVAALLYAAHDDKRSAYHSLGDVCGDRGRFIHDRLLLNPRPVDVLFVGTSKMINALDDRRIEAILREDYGRPINVVNVGYCQMGRNLHYVILKDTLRARAVRHVVLGVPAREPRASHHVFAYLADAEDILAPAVLGNGYFVRDVFLGLAARIERFRRAWLSPAPAEPAMDTRVHGFGASDIIASDEELQKEKRRRLHEHERRRGRWGFSLSYPVHYVEAIAQLCRQHGARLHFLYLPRYGEPWGVVEASDVYGRHGDLLFPPREPFEDKACWADGTHFNAGGSDRITPWMAARIAAWD